MSTVDLLTLRRRFVVLTFLRWFPTGLLIPVLILLLTARGLNLQTVGLVFVAYGLTCVVLELPTGGLADVIGARIVLTASGLLFVVSAVVLAVGQGVGVLTAGAVLAGVARALDSGPLEAWYVDAARAADPRCDLKPALSRAHAAGALALGLGSLAGGGLVALDTLPQTGDVLLLNLSVPYLAAAALGVVGVAYVLAWVRNPARTGPRPGLRDVLVDVPRTVARGGALVSRSLVLRRLSIRAVVVGLVLVTCELLSPLQFEQSVGASGYAVLATLAFVGAAAGARMAPALAHLVRGTGRGLVVVTILTGVLMAGLTLPGWLMPAIAYVLLYVAIGTDDPLIGELLHEETSASERSTVLSVQSLLGQGGGAATNVGVPALVAATSFDVAWIGIGVVVIGASLLAVGLPRGILADDGEQVGDPLPVITP